MNFAKRRKTPPKIGPKQSELSEQEWLDWRSEGIGGSDAAVALGVHPYKCALELYLDKVKGKAKKVSSNATEWGHTLEPLVIDMVQKRYPKTCRTVQELPLMVDPDYPFLRATMDAGCFGDDGAGIIEAKTALSMHGRIMFDQGLPVHYRAQVLHYLLVSRLSFGILGALTEGYREFFYFIKPELDELEQLERLEVELWQRMAAHDVAWLIDGTSNTAKALERLYMAETPAEEAIDARGDATIDKALEAYFMARDSQKAAESKKKEAENIIKAKIGDAVELHANHAIVKWSKTARGRRFTVKAV